MNSLKHPAFFLDRDGVIIENREHYVRDFEDVVFYPQALSALKKLQPSSYKIIIVTNQSAVGRGLISLKLADEINRYIEHHIEISGGRIDAILMCPHAPQDDCTCRKPRPGLILRAASEMSIDLNQSVLVGDAISDIQAGQGAGVRKNILVRTGRGNDQLRQNGINKLYPFDVYDSLLEAVMNVLSCP
jgi:D-glycero-D-manno-heptose 1,7-bisphosphate phosphatase